MREETLGLYEHVLSNLPNKVGILNWVKVMQTNCFALPDSIPMTPATLQAHHKSASLVVIEKSDKLFGNWLEGYSP